ncbi:Transposon Tf2-5 polyprotein-like protein 3 [Elsinoe fawcettii]|nr:Transposon Tf2-5 polyprotein-like protein 3 [Elsinoe fawcettii]
MFLLDDGAEVNLISPAFALRHDLPRVKRARYPKISSFSGARGHVYGAYKLRVRLADSDGDLRETVGTFYAMELAVGPPVVLGRPWRRDQGVIMDSATDRWRYGSAPVAIEVREPEDFFKDLKNEPRVFAVLAAPGKASPTSPTDPSLPPEFTQFSDVFEYKDIARLPRPPGAEHAIELEPGKKPPFQPLYNLSVKELEVLKEYLETATANRWIRRSTSEAGAPILFVPKKDGSLRLCVDYRGLNEITIKNRHPLPLISETLDRLGRAKWFSKLDLKDAYHRIPIKRGDEWKTAFRTRYGHFEYLVMPFGLTNAPATFQAYINRALGGLVDDICVVYLDDILIYSDTREGHVRHVCEVLERLRRYKLYASKKKCDFFTTEVEFLGYIVTTAGVSMDPRRVIAIKDWPQPKSFHEVQQFTGFTNFYRCFVRHYSKIISPLNALMKGAKKGRKHGPFTWGASEQQAFEDIRDAFTRAPILRHYDPAAPLRIESDASKFAVAAILSQLFGTEWHPIAFWSRKMIPAECNYETHDQELLAIVGAFKQWRHYLEGAPHAVQVLTDHNNLRGFMKLKQLNGRQARWATFLAAFDFTMEHQAGKRNPADAPSRRPDYAAEPHSRVTHLLPTLQSKLQVWGSLEGVGGDGPLVRRIRATCDTVARAVSTVEVAQDQAIAMAAYGLPTLQRVAIAATAREDPVQDPTVDLVEVVRLLQGQDPDVLKLRSQAGSNSQARDSRWKVVDNLLFHNDALCIPRDSALRAQLLRMHHDGVYAGHFGKYKTFNLISRKYFWDSMRKDVEQYVQTCAVCQRRKARRHRPYGELQALPMPDRPWQEITMDFITDLPPSKLGAGVFDAILVIVDRYSKMSIYVPTTKKCTSVELADVLRDHVVRHFGVPRGIVSDRGSVFTSAFWSDFCFETQVRRRLSTAFHPQTDGQTERQNQTLEQYLRCYCTEFQDDWASRLSQAEFASNNSVHTALRMSPFQILYGFHPELHTDPPVRRDGDPRGKVPAAAESAQRMRDTHATLLERWKEASAQQAKYYNRKHTPRAYSVGDLVLLSTKNLKLSVPKKKMGPYFAGPFRVLDAVGTRAYRLALPSQYQIHNVFHVSLLEPWRPREGEEPEESMPLADESEEWQVEQILESKKTKGKKFYLVKWKDWPSEYSSWEPEEHCSNAADMVHAFEEQANSTKRRKSRRAGQRAGTRV